MGGQSLATGIAIRIIPVVFGITVHEVSRGWVANRFGDPSARLAGRLTPDPVKHVNPVGTVALPLRVLFFAGFVLGWLKPVPVDARRLNSPRRDMAMALARPAVGAGGQARAVLP